MISPCVAFPHDALAQTGNRFPGFHCAVTTQITGMVQVVPVENKASKPDSRSSSSARGRACGWKQHG